MCKNVEKFLEELTALTQKHEIILGSCGCCSSIYTNKVHPNNPDGYLGLSGHYTADENGNCISWERNEQN